MMRLSLNPIVLAVLICASVLIVLSLFSPKLQSQKRFQIRYVGVERCRACHESPAIGDQYSSWRQNSHSEAYTRLTRQTPRLKQIIKSSGVYEPDKDRKCLKCHTTGGFRRDNVIKEGVGCEACHGPGEKYQSFGVHATPTGYQQAIKVGMFNIIGDQNISYRKRICMGCHNLERRPCAPVDEQLRREELLTIQKVITVFPHPVIVR